MANNLPNQIHNYPQGGEFQHLFTKKLTRTDLKYGLVLVGDSKDYFQALPKPVLDTITRNGLVVSLYTPNCIINASIKQCERRGAASYFMLRKTGWDDAAEMNGFNVGDDIDCWILYQANEGAGGTYSLLIQKVANQAQEAAAGEEGGN